ncbi:MAG TPA: bifunctional phosphoribosylaminoimidazolecarboxamide formyltransferase/IMP cyclohydrolase [Chloroflexia bacterium]|nr:bifunctional phosphoribosylaminoimidazolecarboxamide formyltransferase/IMP cyclohydrolase [Chloroflexia bacterium]
MQKGPGKQFNAIVSVSDPTNLDSLGQALVELGATIYATGGTKRRLETMEIECHSVSDLTGFPEILGGRVKTLHPGALSGILAKRNDPDQIAQLQEHNLQEIHLVAVNLYPFAETIEKPGISQEEAIEQIDIGGPTMIRAAAKNFSSVVVLSDPADYDTVIGEWREAGDVSPGTRQTLAAKAFGYVSAYDALIAKYLGRTEELDQSSQPASFQREITVALQLAQALRYGENPHQQAALYRDNLPVAGPTLVGSLKQLHGPELSYNNLLDADTALALVRDYRMPAVAIIKHATPCGVACGSDENDLAEVYSRALASDPLSAFGGIVGINRHVDGSLAEHIARTRFDVLIAPSFSDDAVDLLARKKNLRLLAVPDPDVGERDDKFASRLAFRQISGGFLVQTRDAVDEEPQMEPVTLRHPTLEEMADLLFAWRAVKHVRSNAIVLARRMATVGIGGGQTSRVDSVKSACEKAGEHARGAVMASDAFFPFPDGIEQAAKSGVTAVIQPGGSVNDDAIIEAADVAGLAMVFTRKRHFRH